MERERLPMSVNLPAHSDSLYSIVVELRAIDSGQPPATLGRALHAQVLRWIELGNPEVSASIHDRQSSPLSVSGLIGNRRPTQTESGDYFIVRIGILDGDIVQPLLRGLNEWGTEPLILAKFPFLMTRTYMFADSHPLASSSSYSALANIKESDSSIELNFTSPTSFKQKQDIQTFPLTELVFGSLQRRWNMFAPPELQFPEIEWEGVVSAYELRTHALRLEGGAEIGTQGWIRYRFRGSEQARMATILGQYAFFAGVGRKTTMGMGQTRMMEKKKAKGKPKRKFKKPYK
jgi:CRISPR-associated endoribonuclease Cas6